MAKSNEVKPKLTASKKKTTQKALVKKSIKKISIKKPLQKELTARGRSKLNQAPKTKKNPTGGGRPSQIKEVVIRLQKYTPKYPIFSLAKITTIAKVHERTLEEYFAKGKDEDEQGVPEWDGKKRKGSRFVQFYRMILAGREMAIMRATRRYVLAMDKDWKAASKFLATVLPEHWSEKLKIEHSGKIDTDIGINMEKVREIVDNYKKENDNSTKK